MFDLSKDVGEQNNVAQAKPEIVARLQSRMEELDAEITELTVSQLIAFTPGSLGIRELVIASSALIVGLPTSVGAMAAALDRGRP